MKKHLKFEFCFYNKATFLIATARLYLEFQLNCCNTEIAINLQNRLHPDLLIDWYGNTNAIKMASLANSKLPADS
ncbi:hypothetical protein D3C80_1243560 [compost metagenome]